MNIFNFPIKRPITITMGMIMVLILGLLSLDRMPLDLMPEIEFPNMVVFIRYEGAGPEEVEERVAKPLEGAIKTTADIKKVSVVAQEELCFINAEFNWGTDLDAASADLREKIAMVRDVLPADIDEPVVLKINLQEFPVMFMHVDDPTGRRNLADLADIAKDQITPRLERLPGVASAMTLGGLIREIQVNLDKNKMLQYSLGFSDVVNAVRYKNLDMTTGHVDHSSYRFRIRGESEFESIEEIENLIVGWGVSQTDMEQMQMRRLMPMQDPLSGTGAISPIRLKDVAEVVDSYKEKRGLFRIVHHQRGASEGVGLAVMKETDANMVEVAETVRDSMDEIRAALPEGVEFEVSFDLSEIITDSINALGNSAVEGAILAALVIFVFLWAIRPSLIVITAIPLSLLAAFIAMYFSDYTLNIMTLGGMVIAVGKLVDDSIVVLENIYRHIDKGEDPLAAAENGFREVAVAVISATLVAVIIFLPVAFTEGLSAQLFKTFAGTVFFALMASLLVAFTVVPMLSSRLLKKEEFINGTAPRPAPGRSGARMLFSAAWRPVSKLLRTLKAGHRKTWIGIESGYRLLIAWSVDNWGKVLSLAAMVSLLTVVMIAWMVGKGLYEFMPKLVGNMYRGFIELPSGVLVNETDKVMMEIVNRMKEEVPDYNSMFMIVGESGDPARAAFTGGEQPMNQAEVNIRLFKKTERDKRGLEQTPESKLRAMWDDFAKKHPNVEVAFQQAGSMEFTTEKPIIIKIYGDDRNMLRDISDRLAERVAKVPGTRDVTTTVEQGVPEYSYRFNREKLDSYYIPTGLALTEVRTALSGTLASLYREAGKEYDITVRLKEDQRDEFEEIRDVPVYSPMGFHVPLKDVAAFVFDEGPLKIERENSKRLVKVEANKTERALGEISNDIREIIADTGLPEGYSIEFGGEVEDLRDSFIDLGIMFVAAIILVYLILASLYESLIHPVTIMIAVPLAFTGAVGGLYLTGTAFGVTAFIGIIMLVGIVATNSIVLMDFIIEYHRRGMERRQAIIEAGVTRLRPILMTALTTLFGVLPIALGRAEGMELQQPLGIVMVGGLVTSTLLTLVIIPVMYQIFDDFAIDMKKLLGRKKD